MGFILGVKICKNYSLNELFEYKILYFLNKCKNFFKMKIIVYCLNKSNYKMRISIVLVLLFTCNMFGQVKERYSVLNLLLNDELSTFGTAFYGDNQVAFSGFRDNKKTSKNFKNDKESPFLKFYTGSISESGEIINTEIMPYSRKKRKVSYHEAGLVFTKDGKTVYFTRSAYYDKEDKLLSSDKNIKLQIYKATVTEKGKWTKIKALPFNSFEYSTGHPALSPDEKTLYIVSDIKGSYGATDIYSVSINEDGSYGRMVNLGPTINTKGKELFLYIDSESNLYFSSDSRDENVGGLDIYRSNISDGKVSAPEMMPEPINSPKDDFSFILNKPFQIGYFSSDRKNNKGKDDIYFFRHIVINECDYTIRGRVLDSITDEVKSFALVTVIDKNGEVFTSTLTDKEGKYAVSLDCDNKYILKAEDLSYRGFTDTITVKNNVVHSKFLDIKVMKVIDNKVSKDTIVTKSEEGQFVMKNDKLQLVMNPIYFDNNSSVLSNETMKTLDNVVAIMNENSEIVINVGSHTDSKDSKKYNLWLSKRRAKNTVEYIISKGVSTGRVFGKGYGESQLLNHCSDNVKCTAEEHSINRRSEFVVIKK